MIDTYISDHKTLSVDTDLPKPTVNKVTFFYRPINKINFYRVKSRYIQCFSMLDNLNLESLIDHFRSNMSSILDKYAPLKTVTFKPRTSNPSFTSYLLCEKG